MSSHFGGTFFYISSFYHVVTNCYILLLGSYSESVIYYDSKLNNNKRKEQQQMAQVQTIGTHRTTVANLKHEYQSETVVTYHKTAVVRFNEFNIELNTGGWDTVTTKLRMNQTSNQFDLGYHVFQKNFDWFVKIWDKVYPYNQNELVINRISKTVYDGNGGEVKPI